MNVGPGVAGNMFSTHKFFVCLHGKHITSLAVETPHKFIIG